MSLQIYVFSDTQQAIDKCYTRFEDRSVWPNHMQLEYYKWKESEWKGFTTNNINVLPAISESDFNILCMLREQLQYLLVAILSQDGQIESVGLVLPYELHQVRVDFDATVKFNDIIKKYENYNKIMIESLMLQQTNQSKSITSEVYCSLQIEGTHRWRDCPHNEVEYLRNDHRHIFHIKAYKIVGHDDRDTEFILLKHEIAKYIHDHYYNNDVKLHTFGSQSCEMIARELINRFDLSKCEVNEDNENGCILTVNKND